MSTRSTFFRIFSTTFFLLLLGTVFSNAETRKDLYKLLQENPVRAKEMLSANPGEFGGNTRETSLSTADALMEINEWEGAAAMYQLWARVFRRNDPEYHVFDIWSRYLEACLRVHESHPRYLKVWIQDYTKVRTLAPGKNQVRETALPFINERLDKWAETPGEATTFGEDWLALANLVELGEQDLRTPAARSGLLNILIALDQIEKQPGLCNDIVKGLERDDFPVDSRIKYKCAYLSSDSDAYGERGVSGELLALLEGTRSRKKAMKLSERTLAIHENTDPSDPMWPVFTFLTAEALFRRKEAGPALELHKELAKWAAGDPYKDGWGGSSLAALSLWRWLASVEKESRANIDESREFVDALEKLMAAKLIKGVFEEKFFTSIPRLEELLLRGAGGVAWSIGEKEKAAGLFLSYLNIARDLEFSRKEREIKNFLVASGRISRPEIDLLIARRLISLGKDKKAIAVLNNFPSEATRLNRANALMLRAKVERKSKKTRRRGDVAALLDQVERLSRNEDPELHQEVLYRRFFVWFRDGANRQPERARWDMDALIRRYPKGSYTDEALYYLARYHRNRGNVGRALEYYERLRRFEGENDWFNFSYFKPAMILFYRNKRRHHDQIDGLLRELLEKRPDGPLVWACRFWLGRLYEDREGGDREARRWFNAVVEGSPYSYFGVRARMHLNMGSDAVRAVFPDDATRDELRAAYKSSRVDARMNMTSPYYHRLLSVLKSGLYGKVLKTDAMLVSHFSNRLPRDVTLAEVDGKNLIANLGLLIATRQDAMGARDGDDVSKSNLQIAGAVGEAGGDWALALKLAGYEPEDQGEDCFLATAFPGVYMDAFKKAGRGEEKDLMPVLLYSVARQESLFYPAAVSPVGAFGMFQFMPDVFKGLKKKYRLKSASNRYAYLVDPGRSIKLGSLWFGRELKKSKPNSVFFRILKHQAGAYPVKTWIKQWENMEREGGMNVTEDLEYMIETARYISTSHFARRVLRNMAIVYSTGMFSTE